MDDWLSQDHLARFVVEVIDGLDLSELTRQYAGCGSTQAGKAAYAVRKQTVEPVFGIIKSVMGFRQYSLRSKRLVSGEWHLVCMAWNLKRMDVLRPSVG